MCWFSAELLHKMMEKHVCDVYLVWNFYQNIVFSETWMQLESLQAYGYRIAASYL